MADRTPHNEPNSWIEYRKLVLKELEDLNVEVKQLRTDQITTREQIAALMVKSGIWGLIGGLIPVAIGIALWIIKSGG